MHITALLMLFSNKNVWFINKILSSFFSKYFYTKKPQCKPHYRSLPIRDSEEKEHFLYAFELCILLRNGKVLQEHCEIIHYSIKKPKRTLYTSFHIANTCKLYLYSFKKSGKWYFLFYYSKTAVVAAPLIKLHYSVLQLSLSQV